MHISTNIKRGDRFAAIALVTFAVLALSGGAAYGQKAKAGAKKTVRKYTIEQFLTTTSITGSSFSPDEKSILFSSNKTGIFNAYSVPVSGGEPKQLTRSTGESTYLVSSFPADSRFIYTYDQGGNENNHLYVLGADGKERDLTPGDKLKAEFLGWSRDGKAFYLMTNERDPRFFDIYKMDAASYGRKLLYQDDKGYTFGDITSDEKYIALNKASTTVDSDIYLYDVATKELKHLTPHKGDVSFSANSFDRAGRYLYYLTNEGGEFAYAARYDLSTGKSEPVEKAGWDVMFTYFSHNGKYRVVGIN